MNRTAWGRQWTQAKGPCCPSSLYTTSEETVPQGGAISCPAKSSADLRSLLTAPSCVSPLVSPHTSFYTQSLPWDVTSKGQATFKCPFPMFLQPSPNTSLKFYHSLFFKSYHCIHTHLRCPSLCHTYLRTVPNWFSAALSLHDTHTCPGKHPDPPL